MNAQDMNLSALISTRICHDLINPIGAISNGIELLESTGGTPSPEIGLINDSAALANAKLNIFRVAFGNTDLSTNLKGTQVERMIRDMYASGRLSVSFSNPDDALKRGQVKLALLLLFCMESSLPLGGECRIHQTNGTWSLRATAKRVNPNISLWDVVRRTKPGIGISPSDVHFLVAELTSSQIGAHVDMRHDETHMTVTFTS